MNFLPNPSADYNQYNSLIDPAIKRKLKNALIAGAVGSFMDKGVPPPDGTQQSESAAMSPTVDFTKSADGGPSLSPGAGADEEDLGIDALFMP
jgi:hypothetical protein